MQYIHFMDNSINTDDISGIFDLDNCGVSRRTHDFFKAAEKRGIVKNLAEDIPRTFVLTENKKIKQSRLLLIQTTSRALAAKIEEKHV